eukprot:CAMPEP_0206282428 /NCGR_PEP_ID=MMETSP0047_2-20121206/39681_1 /ASSEMBLY_ACC=CAM_ASM_000192 /TAXON_ID=195065 /ORGANISM="Chroomonas mesostigmatica_cf, Strain CCMP1168" /LENGTH=89 /DNA_ID=CAMNT_0053712705 /DNA_START=198 /DNA_END=468 /DNA_ORIENTATION=+
MKHSKTLILAASFQSLRMYFIKPFQARDPSDLEMNSSTFSLKRAGLCRSRGHEDSKHLYDQAPAKPKNKPDGDAEGTIGDQHDGTCTED